MYWYKLILGLMLSAQSMTASADPADTPQRDLVVRGGQTIAMQINDQPGCCQSNANRSPLDAMILNFAIL
ncbi:MAG: hypothetical protein RSE16_04960 [Sphingobium sp.]|nr:MAG: hypothetical protein RSE16_04960 [Sphingobium sp.]